MLDRPSDDEVSSQILGVFVRHRIPASGILQRNDFFDVRDGDFQRGLSKGGRERLDHDRPAQPVPLPTHRKGLCRGADDRPGTWPLEFRFALHQLLFWLSARCKRTLIAASAKGIAYRL